MILNVDKVDEVEESEKIKSFEPGQSYISRLSMPMSPPQPSPITSTQPSSMGAYTKLINSEEIHRQDTLLSRETPYTEYDSTPIKKYVRMHKPMPRFKYMKRK